MQSKNEKSEMKTIAIIGAGIMGSGIAQLFAQSGYKTMIYDTQQGAAQRAKEQLIQTFEKLLSKKKISTACFELARQQLCIANSLQDLAQCDLVIEAIIENLEIKQKLFQELETVVSSQSILASNTSSLSITSIAAKCQHPERIVGLHFFNPVALMKVAEVIGGLKTNPTVIGQLQQLIPQLGHRAVIAKDTPGFIINHAGRAYGTEALKILNENVSTIEEIDRILRDGAGFKMGPFELLDLTGLDVSHPVMESIYHQYYEEPRYKPNSLTQQMLEANLLGRKTQHGFYTYPRPKEDTTSITKAIAQPNHYPTIWLAADFIEDYQVLEQYLLNLNIRMDSAANPDPNSLCIVACYGEDSTHAALRYNIKAQNTVAIDLLTDFNQHRSLMPTLLTTADNIAAAQAIFSADQTSLSIINESAGFIAQRVLAMVINLACDIAQQQIANVADINDAVRLGLGYPFGPIEWGDHLGANKILLILQRMTALTSDPRYRPSPWLQRRVALNLPLTFTHA